MKLKEVGAHSLGDAIDKLIIRIDYDGDAANLAARYGGEHASFLDLDKARALGKEDEADEVGTLFRRDINDGGRPHAADFDLHRHWLCSRMRVRRLKRARAGATLCQSGPPTLPPFTLPRPQPSRAGSRPRGGAEWRPSSSFSSRLVWRRRSRASRAPARAVRRHLPWLNQVAVPPTIRPRANAPSRNRNNGASTDRRGST